MNRIVSILGGCAWVVSVVVVLTVVDAGPAVALGGQSLACRVGSAPLSTGGCASQTAAGTYAVDFEVLGAAAGERYSWAVSPAYPVASGCGDTTGCTVVVGSSKTDHEVTATVTIVEKGGSETLHAIATINAVCGRMFC